MAVATRATRPFGMPAIRARRPPVVGSRSREGESALPGVIHLWLYSRQAPEAPALSGGVTERGWPAESIAAGRTVGRVLTF